jgi:hypothetical protein
LMMLASRREQLARVPPTSGATPPTRPLTHQSAPKFPVVTDS